MGKKTYSVFWTKSAQNDLLKIIDYIDEDSKINAKKIFQKIKLRAIEIENFPNKGRIVSEFQEYNLTKYREIIVSPWRLIYTFDDDKVYILCVIDSRRDIEELLFHKLIEFEK
jgi:addiction module RelE/StbE family toxin